MYLVFTRMPGKSYRRQLRSLLLFLCYAFWTLINSLVCWSQTEQWLHDMDNQVLPTTLLEPNSHRTVTPHSGQPCFTYTSGAKLTQNRDSSPWTTMFYIHYWSQTRIERWVFTMDYHVLHYTLVEPNSHFTKDYHVLHTTLLEPNSHRTVTLHHGLPCFTYNTIGAKLRTVSENRQTRERNVSCN